MPGRQHFRLARRRQPARSLAFGLRGSRSVALQRLLAVSPADGRSAPWRPPSAIAAPCKPADLSPSVGNQTGMSPQGCTFCGQEVRVHPGEVGIGCDMAARMPPSISQKVSGDCGPWRCTPRLLASSQHPDDELGEVTRVDHLAGSVGSPGPAPRRRAPSRRPVGEPVGQVAWADDQSGSNDVSVPGEPLLRFLLGERLEGP